MSLGLVDLEVLIKSGRPQDRTHAAKIFPVVKNQHLLLCTLLIGNSLAMEALPIFLDKLVPPWAAILISVTLILLFGEVDIAPSHLHSLWLESRSDNGTSCPCSSFSFLSNFLSN
ncbi:hypothetical protein Goarm_009119 [Gossypium armourianum]|uniref:CNNM transmembrane domain-containing protein n=1 Tax=Gossypium armourianum TaxID=34283 RepID=A0A7J9JRV6_9ROSI|nr:hypothetical protein [Gossypium armourianum]